MGKKKKNNTKKGGNRFFRWIRRNITLHRQWCWLVANWQLNLLLQFLPRMFMGPSSFGFIPSIRYCDSLLVRRSASTHTVLG
ncbi:hypothetical protein K1T71_014119 [Dendrolimus kikuchii]|uniref:Uncharacterized protein n=1 Tax=Dendrolimus kikuchii TaxID=765133 RepID=A0ACC1CF70_9NEOP|nr:hypothetical protein K1T71_014119 [Dendrolimus kikuchii]